MPKQLTDWDRPTSCPSSLPNFSPYSPLGFQTTKLARPHG